jgi:sphingomyelin phosphodiesterase
MISDSLFVSILQEICTLSGVKLDSILQLQFLTKAQEDGDVCEGAIAREGPNIAHALRNLETGSKTSKLFCITFFGVCPYPDITPYDIYFPTQKSPIPRPAPSKETPIQIVHFSDIHVDRLYVPGSSTNCTKHICCRPYSPSDTPGNTDFPAGPYGDHKCDVPLSLERSMYIAIEGIDPSFSIFTGDIIDHVIWNTSRAQNTININLAYTEMKSLGQVYETIGNHEADPVYSYPPTAVDDSQWIYNTLSSLWSRWIGREAAAAEKKFGAYCTQHAESRLRIISLNTNLYYIHNH